MPFYKDAIATSVFNRQYAKWPSRRTENRLEPEAWPNMRPSFRIQPGSTIFTIGSCFARNIEDFFFRLGFRVPTLDFKVPQSESGARTNLILNKYTPPSIFDDLDWTARVRRSGGFQDSSAVEKLMQVSEDHYIDVHLGGFVPVTYARAIERRRQVYDLFAQAFTADVVTITLGLIEAWWDNAGQRYLQLPPPRELAEAFPERFEFRVLSYEDCRDFICKSVELLNSGAKRPNILLTTSPIPLERTFTDQDVLIANCYSKSLLRTVAGYVADRFDNVDYFPSYETVTLTKSPDILLDDLVHVTEQFIGRIVLRVYEAYVDELPQEALESAILRARAACSSDDLGPARELILKQTDANVPKKSLSTLAYLRARVLAADGSTESLGASLRDVVPEELIGPELLHLGRMQLDANNTNGAMLALRLCMQQGVYTDVAARLLLDRCLEHAESPKALAAEICEYLVAVPIVLKNSLAYWLLLAQSQEKAGNIGEAWKAAKNAASHDASDSTLSKYVGELASALLNGDVESAIFHARAECWDNNLHPARALTLKYRLTDGSVPQGCHSAFAYLLARVISDYDSTDETLSELLHEIDPDVLDAVEMIHYGRMQGDVGDIVAAETTLRRCLKNGVVLIAAQLLIGRCLNKPECSPSLEHEILERIEPYRYEDPPGYWFTLALLQDKTGDAAAAFDSAKKAAALAPSNNWYVGLANKLSGQIKGN